MARYKRRQTPDIEATQFFFDGPPVKGVTIEVQNAEGKFVGTRAAYVITIQGQKAWLTEGDFVITERDGIHHYPCDARVFLESYVKINNE